jgi:hypothetical protein
MRVGALAPTFSKEAAGSFAPEELFLKLMAGFAV